MGQFRINVHICKILIILYFFLFSLVGVITIVFDYNEPEPVELVEYIQPQPLMRELLNIEEAANQHQTRLIDGLHARDVSCPSDCNNNGFCCDGVCQCYPGFKEDDCSIYDKCHGVYCGHGICNIHSGKCECDAGYSGSDCDVRICPNSAYYDISTDSCLCREGWSGSDCSTCNRYPNGNRNRTYVCCPTGADEFPFALLSIPSERLQKYLGGFMTENPCLLPNKTDGNGNNLDCSCRIESKIGSISSIQSNAQNIDSKSLLISMYKSNMDMTLEYYKPEYISNLLESQARLFKSNIQVCYCNEWSDSGIQFLVVISVLAVVIFLLFVIYFLYKKRKDELNKKDDRKSRRKSQV